MFPLTLLFCFYLVQFSSAFYGTGGLFGFVFGYQKLCLCRCGVAQRQFPISTRSGRLLGGEPITPHQFPWLATVNSGSQTFLGSLISDRHVITAASPLQGLEPGQVSVILGTQDRCGTNNPALITGIESILLHPGYFALNKNNDVALLRMKHVVPFSEYISPICLPNNAQEPDQIAWITSWQNVSSVQSCSPHVAALPVLPSRACYKGVADSHAVTSDKGCLGPLGATSVVCKTDVGAPVMSRLTTGSAYRLAGVISSASCETQETPLYTKITEHIAWIQMHIRSDWVYHTPHSVLEYLPPSFCY